MMTSPFRLLTLCTLTPLLLSGCASDLPYWKGNPQIVAEPDKVSAMLADAADRASSALETLASIEAEKRQIDATPQITNAPPTLMRGITVNWIGPVEPITKQLANRASYRFDIVGAEPATPLIVSIDAENQPIVEVLRDIGLQMGSLGKLHVNAQTGVVELSYASPLQNPDDL